MVKAATIFGILLIGNGLFGYMGPRSENVSESANVSEPGSNSKSKVTALIPAFVGIVILLCGFGSALNDGLRKHLMHFSAIVALLGALASGGRLFAKFGEASNFVQTNQAIMVALCAGYLIACIISFRAARKRREEANATN